MASAITGIRNTASAWRGFIVVDLKLKGPASGAVLWYRNDGTFLEAGQGCAMSENNRCVTPRNRDARNHGKAVTWAT
jgi:hypothetical protein